MKSKGSSKASEGWDDEEDSSEEESFQETPQFSILNVIKPKKTQRSSSESSGSGRKGGKARSFADDDSYDNAPVQQSPIRTKFKRYDEESSDSHSSHYDDRRGGDRGGGRRYEDEDSYTSYSSYSDDRRGGGRGRRGDRDRYYDEDSYTSEYSDDPPRRGGGRGGGRKYDSEGSYTSEYSDDPPRKNASSKQDKRAPPPKSSSKRSEPEVEYESASSYEEIIEEDTPEPQAKGKVEEIPLKAPPSPKRGVSRNQSTQSEYTEVSITPSNSDAEESMEIIGEKDGEAVFEGIPEREPDIARFSPQASFHTSPEVHEPVGIIFEEENESETTSRSADKKQVGNEDEGATETEGSGFGEGFVVQSRNGNTNEQSTEDEEETVEEIIELVSSDGQDELLRNNETTGGEESGFSIEVESDDSHISSLGQSNHKPKRNWFGRKTPAKDDKAGLLKDEKEEKPERRGMFGFGKKKKDDEAVEHEFEDAPDSPVHQEAPILSDEIVRQSPRPPLAEQDEKLAKEALAPPVHELSVDSLKEITEHLDHESLTEENRDAPMRSRRSGRDASDELRPSSSGKKKKRKTKKIKKKRPEKGGDPNMAVLGVSEDDFEDEVLAKEAPPSNRAVFACFSGDDPSATTQDSDAIREKMALKATQASKRERARAASRSRARPEQPLDPSEDFDFVKKNGDDYDEELGMPPSNRDTEKENRRMLQLFVLICCCLCIIMIGASFGAAWWAVKLAQDDDDSDSQPDIRNSNFTEAPTASPVPSTPTAPTPSNSTSSEDENACPDGNVAVDLTITFDGNPGEVGMSLRDTTTRSPIWEFETGTFRSFSQLLRENYFRVCIPPTLDYELSITDTANTGLISQLLGQNVYGKFSIFFDEMLVSNYDGDCEEVGTTDCGEFCSCDFVLSTDGVSGGCTTDCPAN